MPKIWQYLTPTDSTPEIVPWTIPFDYTAATNDPFFQITPTGAAFPTLQLRSEGVYTGDGTSAPTPLGAGRIGGDFVVYNTSRSAGRVPGPTNLGPRDNRDRWSSKLCGLVGMNEVMRATAGARVSWDETDVSGETGGGWVTIMHRTTRRKASAANVGWICPDAGVGVADWINDCADVNGGTAGTRQNARTTAIGKNTMRFVISHAISSVIWEPTDTTGTYGLVYGGTASTATATTYSAIRERPFRGAVAGPEGYRSMPNGATVSIPLPPDYPGSALAPLAVCFGGVNGITSGQVASSGTGIAVKTMDLTGANVADPTHINPLVMRFTGSDIPPGASTVVLTITTAGADARFLRAWVESPEPPPVLAFNTAYMNPSTGGIFFTHLTEADFDHWNTMLSQVVTEFDRANRDDHVHYLDINEMIGGDTPTDTERTIFFTDTMHGDAAPAAEYALLGDTVLTGQGTTDEKRRRARRSRAPSSDIRFVGSISANVAIPNNGTSFTINVELEDHSGLHSSATNPTRVHLMSEGIWRLSGKADWSNSQGNFNLTGTVAKTAASDLVTGTGTSFTTELSLGQTIRVPGTANEDRIITAIISNTSLRVGAQFDNTATGQTAVRIGPTGIRGIGYTHYRDTGVSRDSRSMVLQPQEAFYNAFFPLGQAFSTTVRVEDPYDYVEFTAFQNAGTGLTDTILASPRPLFTAEWVRR